MTCLHSEVAEGRCVVCGQELVELSELLDAIEVFTRRYVVLDEVQATAVTLWVVHAWAIDAAHATPYLFVTSAEPESGKTRLLEVLHELVREPLLTMNISDAALYRVVDDRSPVLFFDEVDSIFNPKARERGLRDDLRAILNAGYRRGHSVYRMSGRTNLQSFRVFGPKALAGLGTLPPTLASRCLRIELKRRRMNEPVEDFFPQDIAEEAGHLREQLEAWTAATLETLKKSRPERIEGVRDRTMEVWRPLLAIAELDGEKWAARARRAALALTGSDDEPSLGLLLLEDARTVFGEKERLSTADLIALLAELDESPWAEWWIDDSGAPNRKAARRLAHLLRPYGIRSRTVRIGDKTPKGYQREDFADSWERFLPPRPCATSATSATPAPQSQAHVADVADVADRPDGHEEFPCDVHPGAHKVVRRAAGLVYLACGCFVHESGGLGEETPTA